MKITLKRKVELKSAVAYLKIQAEARREDIKNYLESSGFPNPIIERGVIKYLQSIGIYDNNRQLTDRGQKTRQTGLVEETEEGKYQIWYTQGDPLFGTRIFYFRRIKPETRGNPQLEPLDLNFQNKTFVSLPIFGKDGKEPAIFSVIDRTDTYRGEKIKNTVIDCTWTWNDMQNSFFNFYGNLDWLDTNEKQKQKNDSIDGTREIDMQIDFRPYISEIIPNWNEQTGRCRLKLEYIDTPDVMQYFEYSGHRQRNGFDSCNFEKLPVEPYNFEEAAEWRNRLLKAELEKRYVHPDDFASDVITINRKDGFTAYAEQLDIPEIEQFIDRELESGKKSERDAAYWHLAAPLDLYPGIPQSLRIDSFSLKNGDRVSFGDIAQKFKNGKFHVENAYYFDSYVANYYQQRSVAALLKSLDVPNMCIITDKSNQYFSTYLSRNEPHIFVENIGSIYPEPKDRPHDRYLVLKHDNNLQVWTGTNSIDYIRFDKGIRDIQPDTPGHVIKSVTYTKIDPDVLESNLKNFILKG
jgi:hypothetical protein